MPSPGPFYQCVRARFALRSRALADVFGFRGTPGLVIGRTVLNGAVDRHLIERILDDERNQPPLAC